jgi:hypothetical protein
MGAAIVYADIGDALAAPAAALAIPAIVESDVALRSRRSSKQTSGRV